MYIIGLTGGIASGKSTVSTILAELGIYIIDADEIARSIVMPREPAWHEIVAHFGSAVLLTNGQINREILGEKIFKNKEERQWLESVTHPYIQKEINIKIEQAKLLGEKCIVLDIPLLFEIGWESMVNEIWVVYVREEVQIPRLMARNQFTHQQAMDRIDAQMSLIEKVKKANVVIDNNLDIEHAKKQVSVAWGRLRNNIVGM